MTKQTIIRVMTGFLLLLSTACASAAQPVCYSKADSLCIVSLLKEGQTNTLFYARKFLGKPYVAYTLEVNNDEQLVINTRELDCTTLVETVAALTLCARQGKKSFADYAAMLRQLRYRQGLAKDYTCRLHYFSDWIEDNTRMGFVSEVQKRVAPFTALQQLSIHYMSKHPNAYAALKAHPEFISEIAKQERELTGRHYRYIPKSQVKNTAGLRAAVHDGDIIAITTSKDGLDIAHLGFAVWHKDGLHLLNASQLHKKVVEEPMTLRQYLSKHPKHTGIRVIRLQDNKK